MFVGGVGLLDTYFAGLATPNWLSSMTRGHFAAKRLIVGYWTLVG
jgi:hypothetical protein